MSHKATRKSQAATIAVEDKEKSDSPVKEMKKKIAANAEKEKQAAEKTEKPAEKSDKTEPGDKSKPTEKIIEKSDKHDKAEKNEKSEKAVDKKADKPESKAAEKKTEKPVDKKPEPAEKKEENKADKSKDKPAKAVNGTHNGGTAANGDDTNTTVSDSSDVELVIEEDELFPELTYEDSDDAFESEATSRSLTRRSQSKESKLLKLKDDAPNVPSSDRKLRSADSPKPESKKVEKKHQDSPKKQDQHNQEDEKQAPSKKDLEEKEETKDGKKGEKIDKVNPDVVELDSVEEAGRARTRARVSPYSRARSDVTLASAAADYTGNNSTMEMDITETSSILEDPSLNDSGYLRGLRGIRGRSSYKVLHEMRLTNPNANKPRPPPVLPSIAGRPTGAVVGRKRKPSDEEDATEESVVELANEAVDDREEMRHGKRMKLLDRLSLPFRRSGVTHRSADIVGIYTDLPLTAPVSAASRFDPESIKSTSATLLGPLPPTQDNPRDANRCSIM